MINLFPARLPSCSLLAALGLASGCIDDKEDRPQFTEIYAEFNEALDFSEYKTFAVIDAEAEGEDAPPPRYDAVKAQLYDAIVAEMEARGLVRSKQDQDPDLRVSPFVQEEDEHDDDDDDDDDDASFDDSMYGYYWGYEYQWTFEADYSKGTLLLDVVDVMNGYKGDDVLAFRGVARNLMAREVDVIKLQTRNAIAAMFDRWPGSDGSQAQNDDSQTQSNDSQTQSNDSQTPSDDSPSETPSS